MAVDTSAKFDVAARAILAHEVGAERVSTRVAEAVVHAWERLARHFARIVGEDGIRTILARSVTVASGTFPWLVADGRGLIGDRSSAGLRAAMAIQDPDVIAGAFGALLAAFSALLGRLIGDELVARLLFEVWPEIDLQAGTSRGPT
ncbi:MAG: hypothetical protein NT062_34230 [Proteobacteria bacterium]|nr:hypothetical protein [Pseudomonadota bacterium]